MGISLKWIARGSVYLLLVACSQPLLESYGCACASRSYTSEELAGYRAGAAQNDLSSLGEMEEYHGWRKLEHEDGSAAYIAEQRAERAFFERRLALNDREALETEIDRLWYETVFNDTPRPVDWLSRAKILLSRHQGALTLQNYRTLEFNAPAKELIDNELRMAREQGRQYSAILTGERRRRIDLQHRRRGQIIPTVSELVEMGPREF